MDINKIREDIIGLDKFFETPYGNRIMTYADYTASGKSLKFIESYLLEIQKMYANTHTEDDATGKTMTRLLHKAEKVIKNELNALDNCYIISTGTGATGAIQKLSEILGLYFPPATKERLLEQFKDVDEEGRTENSIHSIESLVEKWDNKRPIVFIGPYEHHSNILMWRESIAEVVEIGLNNEGYLDLDDLKNKLQKNEYKGRMKIGSFSAASNVTGIKTLVYDVARILHENDALACFDFAASGPYVEINMNKDEVSYFDAVFFSPHKFLGGPGSSGVLVLNSKIYNENLPPTISGGGTVDYVSSFDQDYYKDPEEREKAGTPGIMQIIKAALAIELKGKIGIDTIDKIEEDYTNQMMERFMDNPNVDILGPNDPQKRVSIISFMVKRKSNYLHPRFVTKLLNDLFGIQSRAGCACAGPYGHRLLGIDNQRSEAFRSMIQVGVNSLKPGWTRVNLHYSMLQEEVDYILEAIEFVAEFGHLFLQEYDINLVSGEWSHKISIEDDKLYKNFGILESMKIASENETGADAIDRFEAYKTYFDHARRCVEKLEATFDIEKGSYKDDHYESLRWFEFINSSNAI